MKLVRLAFWVFAIGLGWQILVGYKGGSAAELKALVRQEWPSPSEAVQVKAAAVSGCEAGWRAHAVGDGNLVGGGWWKSIGPFQIRTRWDDPFGDRSPFLNFLPFWNARAAYHISNAGADWSAWTCGHAGGA